jgi:hypothetical protein
MIVILSILTSKPAANLFPMGYVLMFQRLGAVWHHFVSVPIYWHWNTATLVKLKVSGCAILYKLCKTKHKPQLASVIYSC